MGFNLMAGGLTGDWDFTHFDHKVNVILKYMERYGNIKWKSDR